MVSECFPIKPASRRRLETKRVSDGEEPPVLIPVVLDPVQIRVAIVHVLVESDDVAVTVRIGPEMYRISSVALLIEYSLSCIVFGMKNPPIFCTK